MIRVHVRRGWLGLGALAALVALAALSGALSAPARSAGRPADGNAAVSTAFPGAHYPNQPLIDALHGADISGVASVLVAAGSYLGLRRVMA